MTRAKQKSDVGTAMARMSEAQFGLAADAPVIPGIESMEDWQALHDTLVADLAPVGALEAELAERIASVLWRARRPARYEREYIAASIERVPEDFRQRSWALRLPHDLHDAEESFASADRALELLQNLGNAPPLLDVSHADIECILVALANDSVLEQAMRVPIPGFEETVLKADLRSGSILRLAFRELSRHADMKYKDVLAYAITELSKTRERYAADLSGLIAEQDRMRRERSLPEAGTLHALTRYESTLHRQLIQLMHELEAAQARRRGQTTPLLRGDIHLVAEK